jgi:polysaccharide export outer membrane protein
LNPRELIRQFEAPEEESYTLGEGDEVTIEILGRPELSGRHVVGPDGGVTLPAAGPLKIAGLTREAAAEATATALSRFYSNPSVTVRVDKYSSNRILLLGRVSQPGVQYFERTPTLLEALGRGGLVLAPDDSDQASPRRCAIFRGKDQVVWVDLEQLLQEGSPGLDLRLRRNDVIYVPANQQDTVTVLGEVNHPGVFRLKRDTTLADVLAMAGGLSETAATKSIRLLRHQGNQSRQVALNDVLVAGPESEFSLQNGDVIYIPRSRFGKVGYVLQKLSPVANLLMFGALLGSGGN